MTNRNDLEDCFVAPSEMWVSGEFLLTGLSLQFLTLLSHIMTHFIINQTNSENTTEWEDSNNLVQKISGIPTWREAILPRFSMSVSIRMLCSALINIQELSSQVWRTYQAKFTKITCSMLTREEHCPVIFILNTRRREAEVLAQEVKDGTRS